MWKKMSKKDPGCFYALSHPSIRFRRLYMLSYISTWDILETSRWNNAQYALSHQKVCYFMCGPIWASPYLVGLFWYALSCFRMCLYQAFFGHSKKTQGKKLNWKALNSNFRHFLKNCILWKHMLCLGLVSISPY